MSLWNPAKTIADAYWHSVLEAHTPNHKHRHYERNSGAGHVSASQLHHHLDISAVASPGSCHHMSAGISFVYGPSACYAHGSCFTYLSSLENPAAPTPPRPAREAIRHPAQSTLTPSYVESWAHKLSSHQQQQHLCTTHSTDPPAAVAAQVSSRQVYFVMFRIQLHAYPTVCPLYCVFRMQLQRLCRQNQAVSYVQSHPPLLLTNYKPHLLNQYGFSANAHVWAVILSVSSGAHFLSALMLYCGVCICALPGLVMQAVVFSPVEVAASVAPSSATAGAVYNDSGRYCTWKFCCTSPLSFPRHTISLGSKCTCWRKG